MAHHCTIKQKHMCGGVCRLTVHVTMYITYGTPLYYKTKAYVWRNVLFGAVTSASARYLCKSSCTSSACLVCCSYCFSQLAWPHLSVWKQTHALPIHNWCASLKFWRYSLHFGFLPTSETRHKVNMNFGLSMCRGLYPIKILLLAF